MSGVGKYTTIIREIVLRLNRSYDALGLKALQVMPRETRLQQDMTPYVLVIPDTDFIVEEYGSNIRQNQKMGTANIIIQVSYPLSNRDGENLAYEFGYIVDSDTNHIVDSGGFLLAGDTIGFVKFIEMILDALNTDLDSNISPQLTNNPTRSMGISVRNVVKNELTIDADIHLSVATDTFQINNRQNA